MCISFVLHFLSAEQKNTRGQTYVRHTTSSYVTCTAKVLITRPTWFVFVSPWVEMHESSNSARLHNSNGNHIMYLFSSSLYFTYTYPNIHCIQPFYPFLQYEGKSKTISGRIRSATSNVPLKRPVNIQTGSQSATSAPDRAFSPTKFLVAGLVGGGSGVFSVSPSSLFGH